jgi:glycosyltransferase involved in cell wall biosynthesis
MKLGIIASAQHPIVEPFAGGLEMHTHALATFLGERGHDVTVFASASSDTDLHIEPVCADTEELEFSQAAMEDPSSLPQRFMKEHHAYLSLMLRLNRERFDVVHNNSLHYLPVAMAETISAPVVTTLHTPPTPWLESALRSRIEPGNTSYVAVSRDTALRWEGVVSIRHVIPNGVDLEKWTYSGGGRENVAVWFGRVTPEKGTHLAVDAAHRAGMSIALAGPVGDEEYFRTEVLSRLADDDTYAGHLAHADLCSLVGSAAVMLCTPCWDEPYGLVVAESLACGTPVAAFDRGAMREILDKESGRLAVPEDIHSLAEMAREASRLSRPACRRRAVEHCSLPVMIDRYEDFYSEVRTGSPA